MCRSLVPFPFCLHLAGDAVAQGHEGHLESPLDAQRPVTAPPHVVRLVVRVLDRDQARLVPHFQPLLQLRFGKESTAVRDADCGLEEVEVPAIEAEELYQEHTHVSAGGAGALSAGVALEKADHEQD